MYKAGIAGYFAPQAVFPSLVGRPRVLRIFGRYRPEVQLQWHVQSWFFWCFCTSRCLPEVYRKIGFWEMALIFLGPLVSGSHMFELFA